MNTKFGILTGLAIVMFIGVFTAMLVFSVIWPLGVHGADQPIDENGQGVGFQQSSMVTNVMVTNTPNEPGGLAQYTVTFVTGEVLQANVDTIVFDIDSSVGVPSSIPVDAIRISASAVTGGGQANQSVALSLDPRWESGFEGRGIYTITVPDMDVRDSSGMESIDAGAMVTVTFLFSAGLINPTESGSYDFTVSTSKDTAGVKATFTTPLMLAISDKSDHRDTPITLVGKGFKNGTTVTIYLDRTRDANGQIVNMPDGVRTPGTDVDLETAVVDSDDTFTINNKARVPPFAPVIANRINAIDDENPPNHYNGMGGQTPVTFTVEPLLTTSLSAVSIGDEIEISLVDWPAADRVMDYITPDAQGVDRVKQSAVTIAGIPQEITSGEGPVGPDNEHTFLVRVGATVYAGVMELKVKTYTADQMMSDVPGGASDKKKITITNRCSPGDVPPDPGGVAGDRAALVALYNATDGGNWTNYSGWLTTSPLGEWYGVTTDAWGRVCALNLQGNGLSGQIPEELGNLTNLTNLYLSENQLSGEIPAELGNMANLGWLYIGENRLTGEIPPELGNIAGLVILSLDRNLLSGDIPAGLGNLTNLTELHLSWNQLSGEIPGELGSLTNLTRLYLSFNQLTGAIPEELGNLTNLATLSLEANRLSGAIPAGLGSMTNLTRLYLINNQLSGAIPEELGSLSNLQTLDISGNRLTGPIPAGLGNLTNLTELHLHVNQLSGEMPAELGNLANLTELDFSDNPISGEIPAELGNLTNLRSLRFKGNQLSGDIPVELGNLTSLEALFLSHNRLSGEIPEELTNLLGLFLEHNQLSGEIPEELGNLTNLIGLFLEHNQLSGEIPAGLGSLANLGSVYLSNNRLTGCIPESLRSIKGNDFAKLGLPFCDMLDGSPVVVVRFVSAAGGPVRLGSPVSLEATFSEPVSGFSLEDISVANGVASNFSGSGAVYNFDVTPNAIGEVTIDIADGAAQGADGKGNIAALLSFGIPYDDDGNGQISKSEIIAAINDYLSGDGSIARSHLIDLINLYLFGGTP